MPTLWYPQVSNFTGSQLLDGDFESTAATEWFAEITLHDLADHEADPLTVGGINLITARLTVDTAEMLDAYSAETEIFCELFDGDCLAAEVEAQFEGLPFGIIILENAYLHPAVRGKDLGAWAVAETIHQMSFGAMIFVAGYPCPPGSRGLPAKELKLAKASLARHWQKVGLRPIDAKPHLLGQFSDYPELEKSREELAYVRKVEVEVSAADMAEITEATAKSIRPGLCRVAY